MVVWLNSAIQDDYNTAHFAGLLTMAVETAETIISEVLTWMIQKPEALCPDYIFWYHWRKRLNERKIAQDKTFSRCLYSFLWLIKSAPQFLNSVKSNHDSNQKSEHGKWVFHKNRLTPGASTVTALLLFISVDKERRDLGWQF